MRVTRSVLYLFTITLSFLFVAAVSGQNFPNKPMRIVAGSVGSGVDFAAREIALGLTSSLGQQAVVDNRQSGVLMGEIVSRATPDGHVMLVIGNTFWLQPFLQSNLSWDPIRDFSTITMVASTPNVVAIHPSLAVTSVKELIALAKAKPGELNFASGAPGSSPHLGGELFKQMADVNIVRIPYKGAGPAVNALLGGEVKLMFPNLVSVAPHLKSGRLRALAITSERPSALAPELPTVAASGVPGYVALTISGMFVPAKTPTAIINRINREVVRFLTTPEVKERFFRSGSEVSATTPEQFKATIQSEMAMWGKLIKTLGIRVEN